MKRVFFKTRVIFNFFAALAIMAVCIGCDDGDTTDYSLVPVSVDGEKWGYINSKGEYAINPQFEDADFFSDGLAKIKTRGGKTGYINKKGEYVIPAMFMNGTAFSNGLAFVVSEGGLPTCIDKKGAQKFALTDASRVSAYREGLAVFGVESGERGYVDKNGKTAINAQFERAFSFRGGFARIWRDGVAGFIDKSGTIKIRPQFEAVGNFSEEKAAFYDGKQWGYINTKGGYAINPQFDEAGRFSNGLAAVKQGRMYGYIDKTGKLVINPQFDEASAFSDGLAAVRTGGKYGYINKEGKFEINTQFDFAGDFHNGVAQVSNADKWGFINKNGQYVANPQFKHIKLKPSADARPEFVESDFYDTSEFIKLFFEKEAGNTFDGVNAATTLEKLSEHPKYGAGLNARNEYYSDYSVRIPITNDISISHIRFLFSTPIFQWAMTYNSWGGIVSRSQQFDFEAKPSAIMYQFNLSGKAWEKRNVVFSALKTEIERRQRQSMAVYRERSDAFCLYQDGEKLSFLIRSDGSSVWFYVSFSKEYLENL